MNWLIETPNRAARHRQVEPDDFHPSAALIAMRLLAFCVVAATLALAAAESPPPSALVGELGRKEALVFEGTRTFSGATILRQLEMRLEFHAQANPTAPLADYLSWIERSARQGYLRSGFAQVTVTAAVDRATHNIRVSVAEGPRFTCGALQVTGLEPPLLQQLTNRLSAAEALLEPAATSGQPSFSWPWHEGQHLPADAASLDLLQRSVVAALAELNQLGAEARVELRFAQGRPQADLLVTVTNPGRTAVLDRIDIQGLRLNSREAVLSLLQLRPGMQLSGNLSNDALQHLWASGRFRGHRAALEPLPTQGSFKLGLDVVELTNAPPLDQELTAEEKALLKLREWVLNWRNRPEDWLLQLESTQDHHLVVAQLAFGKSGLACLLKGTASNAISPKLAFALIAAPQHIGYYSGRRQVKLAGTPKNTQLWVDLTVAGNPDRDQGTGNITLAAGFRSASEGTPYRIKLDLAPVVFVALAHPFEGSCQIENGLLSLRSEPEADLKSHLTVEAASGRLLAWQMSAHTNAGRLALSSEAGAFARVAKEIAGLSAGFTNEFDPRHPWSSSLATLGHDLPGLLENTSPDFLRFITEVVPGGFTSEELLRALTMLEAFSWRELIAPLDLAYGAAFESDAGEDFPFVLEGNLPSFAAGNEWLRLLGGMVLKVDDDLWPRGSWPWALVRNATFLAAGYGHCATNDIARLVQVDDTGPLACLVAAQALGRFSPSLAVAFAQQGASRLTPAALQADLRVLLNGEKAGQSFLLHALQRAPAIKPDEFPAFIKLIGTNALPVALDGLAALKANTNIPPEVALRPVLDRHWEQVIRPQLLTAFARLCLGSSQGPGSVLTPAQARQVAGWVQQAAEQAYAPAEMLLGNLYLSGVGVAADPGRAAAWIARAAEHGYPHASCTLGRLYASMGKQEEAVRWFRLGAQEGCSDAEVGLARLLLDNSALSSEQREEALALLNKAAGRGSADAQLYLGSLYEHQGKMEDALARYREAAWRGNPQAQAKLGDLLSDGFSTTPDYIEAWAWFKHSAAQGNRLAATLARSIERNKLKPEQVEEANRRLRQIEKTIGKSPSN